MTCLPEYLTSLCDFAAMVYHQRKVGLRLAHRAPDTPPISASSTVEDSGPIVLNAPSSLTECLPTNITWTGGTQPYSLFVNLADSSETLRQFDGINATHFVWAPNVPVGSFVSFEVVDERSILTFTEDPIFVGAGAQSGIGCNVLGPVSISPTSSISTSISASSSPTSTQSPSPSPFPSMPVVSRANPVSGSTIAATVIGVTIFLLLATFPWWRARVTARRRDHQNGMCLASFHDHLHRIEYALVDTEKQEVDDGRNDSGVRRNSDYRCDNQPRELWSDGEVTNDDSIGTPILCPNSVAH